LPSPLPFSCLGLLSGENALAEWQHQAAGAGVMPESEFYQLNPDMVGWLDWQ